MSDTAPNRPTSSRATSSQATSSQAKGRVRSWLQTGLAALAVSALGLGVAGSVILTGHAQQDSTERPAVTMEKSAEPTVAPPSAFDRRDDRTSRDSARKKLDSTSRDSEKPETGDLEAKALKAKVAERADRRAEELRKASGEASDSAQKAAESARTKDLKAAQQSVKKNGDRLEAAAQAAAEKKKQQQQQEREQAKASQDDGSTDQGSTDQDSTGSDGAGTDQQSPPQQNSTDSGGDSGGSGDSADAGTGKATLPLASYSVAARFGQVGAWSRYHTGFDFAAPIGSPIRAADSGTVTNAGSGSASGWAGNYVTIKHSDGTSSLYAHMSSVSVSVGQQVSGGAHIGNVGVTGRSFGPHCHFEIYPAGVTPGDVYKATNPETWLQARGLNP